MNLGSFLSLIVQQYLRLHEYILEYEKRISAILHEAQQYTTLSALSRITGIKHAQLSHYANAVSQPRPAQRTRILEGIHKIGESCLAL